MFLTDDEFTRLRSRFTEWKQAGYPEIDLGLAPVLEHFNTLPGVVTVTSCMGHARGTPRVKTPFHIYIGATEQGFGLLLQVFQQVAARLLEVTKIYEADLATAKGGTPSFVQVPYKDFQLQLGVVDTLLSEDEKFTYYRIAFVAKGTHLGNIKNNFLAEIINAIERVRAQAAQDTQSSIETA